MVAEAAIGSMGTACMRRFVLGWKTLGCQQRLKACIVNWLNSKHKVHCIGRKRFIDEALAAKLGLERLSWRKGSLPWA